MLPAFLFVGGLHAIAALALLNYFRRTFSLSPALLAVHLPLVVFCIGVASLAAAAIAAAPVVRRWRLMPYIAALLPAIVVTLLTILYVTNFANNLWMGTNVTHKLAELWITDLWQGGAILPVSTSVIAYAIGFTVALIAIDVAIWGRALKESSTWFRLPRRPLTVAGILLVLCGYGLLFQQLSWRTPRSELLSADPILAFLRSTVGVEDAHQLGISARLRENEPRVRAAYPRNLSFDRKHVIIIMVDSLRADHTQLYGYGRTTTPYLSEELRTGRLRKVAFATSTCAESNCGILSTLWSKTLRHQVAENFGLFSLLKDQGYDTRLILSGNHEWQGLRDMYGYGDTQYFDGRDQSIYSWSDDDVIDEGLEAVPQAATPTAFLFHLMSVHLIGTKHDHYSPFQPAAVKNDWAALFRGEYDRETVTNNYDNGVVQADAMIKRIFGTLSKKGYLQNSVAVILSDHGEGLGDRGPRNYGHITSLYQELIHIPMLIYDDPAVEYRGLAFGTQVDVAPTIADRLGLPIPESWEGVSLLQPSKPRTTIHQTTLAMPCFAMIDHDTDRLLKYMHCAVGRREELYDLITDPSETRNLADTIDEATLNRFRTQLDEWRRR